MSSLKTRDSARSAISRYQRISSDEQLEKEQIVVYMELLHQQWERFNDAQQQVEASSGEETLALQEAERAQAEDWYIKAKSNFVKALARKQREADAEQNAEHRPPTQLGPQVRLPVFELPRFDGKPTTWMSFHDSFKAIVHEQDSLTGSQKLHYLRSCLSDEPLQLISNFKLQDNNYAEAWQLLKNRYHVRRVIIDNHFSAIFAVGKAKSDTAQDIKGVLDPIMQNIRALKVMQLPTEHWDDFLVHIIAHKLDYETRRHWELSINDDETPSLEKLQEFLEARCRSLEVLNFENGASSSKVQPKQKPRTNYNISQGSQKTPCCLNCSQEHKLWDCSEFLRLTLQQRADVVRDKNACFNCLSTMHHIKECKSTSTCRICAQRHHTLLHNNDKRFLKEVSQQESSTPEDSTQELSSHHASDASIRPQRKGNPTILLSTALVSVLDSNKKRHIIRVLLDSGSHSSFITESCVQRLGLKRHHKNVIVTGIGCAKSNIRGEVNLKFQPLSSKRDFHISALILPRLTSYVPSEKIFVGDWPHLAGLCLADSKYADPAVIDLILSAGELPSILEPEIIRGPVGTPTAQKTALGWVLFGKVVHNFPISQSMCLHADLELTKLVKQAWNLEEYKDRPFLTAEETRCEELFEETHQRDAEGRFIVTLPFRPDFSLGHSRDIAVKSWLRMESRLNRNQELQTQYNAFLQEMLDQGHMQPVSFKPDKNYYMPHHCVVKETSSTTKTRAVFNASQKTSNGLSLNDGLMVGPTLQQDLLSILSLFQTHRYALIADVAAMYRQVKVREGHTDFQRIVWRKSANEPLQDFRMLRVTYGVASSSHHAVRALQQTTRISSIAEPKAVNAVVNDFYMDDLLTGADTDENLDQLRQNITQILNAGCFELRKWASNSTKTIARIPTKTLGETTDHLLADDEYVRVLGLVWSSSQDELYFNVHFDQPPKSFTKRSFLSDSCRLFDPTGKLAPVTLVPKTLFQRIWQLNINWDDDIPQELANHWLQHRADMKALAKLRIPRWLGTGIGGSKTDLHCFADASEIAYAAVIYVRTKYIDGKITVRLLNSKTKVAPLRTISISRLELCAAALAADLASHAEKSLGLEIGKIYGWTDSPNALAWLRCHPSKWKTFVANRVSKAQAVIDAPYWNYVASECNPSDCASRGMCASKLLQHDLWWKGPSWLHQSEEKWPHFTEAVSTDLELRPQRVLVHSAIDGNSIAQYMLSLCSYFCRLKRFTAYCVRFYENCKRKKQKSTLLKGILSRAEMQRAKAIWVKIVQKEAFRQELLCCLRGKPVPLRSPIARLNAFVDENGILRVGGRLKNSILHHDAKFPIILPARSKLSTLIINDIHKTMMHAGPLLMQATLQRNYWVVGARNLIRKIYRSCAVCLRHSANAQQIMANLPKYRVKQARPFLNVGVDMAGPFTLKFAKGRGAKTTKGYIALCICMATGAMHLELAGDLSTHTFIAVLKRFISRRGHCRTILSDNGTNFVGAERELQSMLRQAQRSHSFQHYITDHCLEWKFNPPHAPNMGGYWEIAVKRVKFHLKRALNNTLLTYEEFNTFLVEVEACVNSRPLCSLPNDAADCEVLTPAHFLITEPLVAVVEPDDEVYRGTLSQRWQLLKQIRNHFWRRWRTEYLTSLQKRAKWLRPQDNLRVGDIVILKDEQAPPTRWPIGKIVKCFPGDDGIVRVAEVLISTGVIKRPTSKLIPILSDQTTT